MDRFGSTIDFISRCLCFHTRCIVSSDRLDSNISYLSLVDICRGISRELTLRRFKKHDNMKESHDIVNLFVYVFSKKSTRQLAQQYNTLSESILNRSIDGDCSRTALLFAESLAEKADEEDRFLSLAATQTPFAPAPCP